MRSDISGLGARGHSDRGYESTKRLVRSWAKLNPTIAARGVPRTTLYEKAGDNKGNVGTITDSGVVFDDIPVGPGIGSSHGRKMTPGVRQWVDPFESSVPTVNKARFGNTMEAGQDAPYSYSFTGKNYSLNTNPGIVLSGGGANTHDGTLKMNLQQVLDATGRKAADHQHTKGRPPWKPSGHGPDMRTATRPHTAISESGKERLQQHPSVHRREITRNMSAPHVGSANEASALDTVIAKLADLEQKIAGGDGTSAHGPLATDDLVSTFRSELDAFRHDLDASEDHKRRLEKEVAHLKHELQESKESTDKRRLAKRLQRLEGAFQRTKEYNQEYSEENERLRAELKSVERDTTMRTADTVRRLASDVGLHHTNEMKLKDKGERLTKQLEEMQTEKERERQMREKEMEDQETVNRHVICENQRLVGDLEKAGQQKKELETLIEQDQLMINQLSDALEAEKAKWDNERSEREMEHKNAIKDIEEAYQAAVRECETCKLTLIAERQQIDNLERETRAQESLIEDLRRESADFDAEVVRLRGELETATFKASQNKALFDQERLNIVLLEDRKKQAEDSANATLDTERARNEQLTQKIVQYEKLVDSYKEGLAKTQLQLNEATTCLKDWEQDAAQTNRQHLAEQERAAAELKRLEAEKNAAQDSLYARDEQERHHISTIHQRELEIAQNKGKLDRALDDLSRIRGEMDAARMTADTQVVAITRERDVEKQKRENAEAAKRSMEDQLRKSEAELAAVKVHLEQLQADKRDMSTAIERTILEAKSEVLMRTLSDTKTENVKLQDVAQSKEATLSYKLSAMHSEIERAKLVTRKLESDKVKADSSHQRTIGDMEAKLKQTQEANEALSRQLAQIRTTYLTSFAL